MALTIAASWTGIIQLTTAILGTFVLKRFPTSFSLRFFLGFLIIVAQQNLILHTTFRSYRHGSVAANEAFADLALALFFVYGVFASLLFHFREHVLLTAAADVAKGGGGGGGNAVEGGRGGNEGGGGGGVVDAEVGVSSYDNFGER